MILCCMMLIIMTVVHINFRENCSAVAFICLLTYVHNASYVVVQYRRHVRFALHDSTYDSCVLVNVLCLQLFQVDCFCPEVSL